MVTGTLQWQLGSHRACGGATTQSKRRRRLVKALVREREHVQGGVDTVRVRRALALYT